LADRRKQALFSIEQFVVLIAWLVSLFLILYFKAYHFVAPSIVAFFLLNLAIGIWLHRFMKPIESKGYRKYLTLQTVFLIIWCPLLFLVLMTNGNGAGAGRTELLSLWAAILVLFYIGLGIVSGKQMVRKG